MKAIGLDHHTRELVGLHRATTANGSLWATGKEIAAALNTTTTGIATAKEIMARTTTGTVITTTIGTKDSARRYTNIYSFDDGAWRAIARQATNISIE